MGAKLVGALVGKALHSLGFPSVRGLSPENCSFPKLMSMHRCARVFVQAIFSWSFSSRAWAFLTPRAVPRHLVVSGCACPVSLPRARSIQAVAARRRPSCHPS